MAMAIAVAMASFQMFVRGLDGQTLCLSFPSSAISGHHLKERLSALVGIPSHCQRIVTGTREITSSSQIVADLDGRFPSCNLLLRLRGGKGGFGSLLRGAATKAGQKKTINFDACRDMSGRRLRHVHAEKKLKEWKADAKERELEKTAEAYLRKQMKQKQEESGIAKEITKYREETSKTMEEVESAVVRGLAEAKRLGVDGKRKKVKAVARVSKRARIWMIGDEDDLDKDDDVSIEGECIEHGESSQGPSDECACSNIKSFGHGIDGNDGSNHCFVPKPDDLNQDQSHNEPACYGDKLLGSLVDDGEPVVSTGREVATDEHVTWDVVGLNNLEGAASLGVDNMTSKNPSENINADTPGFENAHTPSTEKLNFNNYDKAEELEVLGFERLKSELQAHGLKCGGSLAERAARLFLLKTIPPDKLDKKYFAKTK